jgi:hypothetical protein
MDLSTNDALCHELAKYRGLEESLRQQIKVRSAALKQEEATIRKALDALLIKNEMLQCEYTCLEAILRDDRVWVIHYQAWYISAVKASKTAALERMGQNLWMVQESARLQAEINVRGRVDDGACGKEAGDASVQAVREASARFASHSEHVLQCLEANAESGRVKYARAMEQAGKTVSTLRGGIVAMRNYLREIHPAEVANELIVWAEAGGRIARNKARWDFQHPICPLDVVMLEGLRLRLAELEA